LLLKNKFAAAGYLVCVLGLLFGSVTGVWLPLFGFCFLTCFYVCGCVLYLAFVALYLYLLLLFSLALLVLAINKISLYSKIN
jgi:hypothetical protein